MEKVARSQSASLDDLEISAGQGLISGMSERRVMVCTDVNEIVSKMTGCLNQFCAFALKFICFPSFPLAASAFWQRFSCDLRQLRTESSLMRTNRQTFFLNLLGH